MSNVNEEQDIISLFNEQGDEELFEVLFSFHDDDYNKDYIFVYPAGADLDEGVDIFPFIVNSKDTEGTFGEIEDDAEFEMVSEALNRYLDEAE
jgi:uncharacterized protein YrzB (UPF0473 family)